MTQPHAPRSELRTHSVFNQSEPLSGINLFSADRVLSDAVSRNGGDRHGARLSAFGARVGSAEVQEWGRQANESPPKFKPFDRYGHRIDEVEFHPAYHQLMRAGLEAGVSAAAWNTDTAPHTLHSALLMLMGLYAVVVGGKMFLQSYGKEFFSCTVWRIFLPR